MAKLIMGAVVAFVVVTIAMDVAVTQPMAARPSYTDYWRESSNSAPRDNASIAFITPHSEVVEGEDFALRCDVELVEADEVFHAVEWAFVPSTADGEAKAPLPVLARDGDLVHKRGDAARIAGLRAQVRTRWDTVNELNVEEQYLNLEPASAEHQGMYICQVMLKNRKPFSFP